MKYIGYWSTESSYNKHGYSNKKEAIQNIKKIAKGNCCAGGECYWCVSAVGVGEDTTIAEGTYRKRYAG